MRVLQIRPHVQLGKASGWCVWRTMRAVRVVILDPAWSLLALEEEVCLVWSAEATRWDFAVSEVFVFFAVCGTLGPFRSSGSLRSKGLSRA